MTTVALRVERTIVRRVFAAWSITLPASMAETFVEEDAYWHAWDEHRSVSMTSVLVTEKGRPVSADRIARQLPPMKGTPLDDRPPGLIGSAMTGPAVEPTRASRILSGFLAVNGRLLIVTVTCDDLDLARTMWRSIRYHDVGLPSRRTRRAMKGKRRR